MTPTHSTLAKRVMGDPVHWIPFGFGAGLLPLAPGTWGSLLAVALFWLAPPLSAAAHAIGIATGFVLGAWLCGVSARRLARHDHPGIVFDEMLAMWATLAVIPRGIPWTVAALVLFRVLDVWKPWPIREADHRLGGGLGIMLDDVLAAAFAAVILLSVRNIAVWLT